MDYPARHIRFLAKCGQDVVAMDTLTSDARLVVFSMGELYPFTTYIAVVVGCPCQAN
jgi:hypothetical protein